MFNQIHLQSAINITINIYLLSQKYFIITENVNETHIYFNPSILRIILFENGRFKHGNLFPHAMSHLIFFHTLNALIPNDKYPQAGVPCSSRGYPSNADETLVCILNYMSICFCTCSLLSFAFSLIAVQ